MPDDRCIWCSQWPRQNGGFTPDLLSSQPPCCIPLSRAVSKLSPGTALGIRLKQGLAEQRRRLS